MEKSKLAQVMGIKLDGIKHNIETRYKLECMAIHKY